MERTEPNPRVSRSFRAHPASLYDIREFVRGLAEADSLPGGTTNDLVLAISEACANAVLHSESQRIDVSWKSDGFGICVEVVDQGVFKRRVPLPEFEDPHGHGIPLMIALVDEVGIKEGTDREPGTRVRLMKRRDSVAAPHGA